MIRGEKDNQIHILQPGERDVFYFFGEGEQYEIKISIIDKDENWSYSLPFVIQNQSLMTIQLLNYKKTKRKFINISSKIFNISNLLTFTEAKINNARIRINNYSSSISMKVYQK